MKEVFTLVGDVVMALLWLLWIGACICLPIVGIVALLMYIF